MAADKEISIVITAKNLSSTELGKARAEVLGFKQHVEGASGGTLGFGAALRSASSVAGLFGVTLGAAGLAGFGKALLDDADATVKLADKLGETTTGVQQLKYIAEQSGNTLENLAGSVSQLQKRLGEGDDSAVAAVKALGLSIDDLQQMSPSEGFMAIAREVAKIEDPTKRAAVAAQLFGKSGMEVLPSLIANVDKLAAEAPVMSDASVRAFDDVGDSLNRMWGQLKVTLGEALVKVLTAGIGLVKTFKSVWDAIPGPLKTVGEVAVIAAAGLWALNAASSALGKTQLANWAIGAAGGIKELGMMTKAFGWEGFAVTLGKWAAPLKGISTALAGIGPAGWAALGALAGLATAAVGTSALVGGAKGYQDLRKGIESVIGPARSLAAATTEQVDADARYYDAASKRAAAERAHASLLDTLKSKQGALTEEVGRFTSETLADAVKAIRTNKAAFDEWAEAQHLSKEAIALLEAEAKKQEDQEKRSADAAKKHAEAKAELAAVSRTLTSAEKDRIGDLASLGVSEAAIAELTGIHEAAVRKYLQAVKEAIETEKEWAKAIEALDESRVAANTYATDTMQRQNQALMDRSTENLARLLTAHADYQDRLAEQSLRGLDLELYRLDRAYQAEVASLGQRTALNAHLWDQAKAGLDTWYTHERETLLRVPSLWEQMIPGVKQALGSLETSAMDSFAKMLTGAQGFKEGFVDIWSSIKTAVQKILSDLLSTFTNTFLKGLLGAIQGQQGAFASAFGGLFEGLATSAGSALVTAGGATVPAASLVGTEIGTGAMLTSGGAGAAGAGLAASLGASLAAAGGGFLAGSLGKKLTGGAGLAAGGIGAAGGAATGALMGSILPGIGTAIGAVIGGVTGLISGLFGKSEYGKVKEARAAYEQAFGGVDAMIAKVGSAYATLGKSGFEAQAVLKTLWEAKSVEAYNAAVSAINANLDAAAKKEREITEATEKSTEAQEKKAAAIAKVNTKYDEQAGTIKDQLGSLQRELDELNALEAPEEVMGVIEQQTRARIAAEQEALEAKLASVEEARQADLSQLEETETTYENLFRDVVTTSATAAAEVAEAWREPPWSKWGEPPMAGQPGSLPGYASGALITSPHYAHVGEGGEPELIGPVGFMTEALAGALGALGATAAGRQVIDLTLRPQLVVDGRVFAELLTPYIPDILKRYGLVRT